MLIASGFSLFHLIPGLSGEGTPFHGDAWVIAMAWTVAAVVIVGALITRVSLNAALSRPGIEKYFADSRFTPRTIAEVFGEGLFGLVRDILGEADAKKFFPYLAALFVYLFVCNAIGLIPGLASPTGNISHNVALAIVTFLVFNGVGLGRDAIGYIKHLLGPVTTIKPSVDPMAFVITLGLAPLLFVIEVFGLTLRPFTLSVRLTANMFGDHSVFGAMSDLSPVWVPVPAIFLGFGLFVSFIQAFVFTLLTTIYISLSKPHHEDHEGHDDDGHGAGHGHDHAHAH